MSSTWANTWIGIAGGGFGFSIIGGIGVYGITLHNMGNNPVPIRALIIGKRLGLTIGAEASHAVCIMTGVKSESDFTTLTDTGVDWNVSAGVDLDSFVKGGSKAINALLTIAKGAKNASWASNEAAKKVVNYAMGDLSLDFNKKNFYLIPTPLALSVGIGIWYEWQTLYKTGTDMAWKYVPPTWKLESRGGKVYLRVQGIPERDNSTIVFNIRIDTFGRDDRINFAGNHRVNGYGIRESATNLRGSVHRGQLYPFGKAGRGQDGICLTDLKTTGKTETGMLRVSTNNDIDKSEVIKIGISICKGTINLYRWESDDYIKVRTNTDGALATIVGAGLLWRD